MKKMIVLCSLIFLMISHNVYGGDAQEIITPGKQDALIIGKIVEYKDGKYQVSVEKLLLSTVLANPVAVEEFPSYFLGKKPVVGDYCVLSLDKKDDHYQLKFMAFKADKADPKTLKLEKGPDDVFSGTVQEFINTERFIQVDKASKEGHESNLIIEAPDTKVSYNDKKMFFMWFVTILGVLGVLGSILIYRKVKITRSI